MERPVFTPGFSCPVTNCPVDKPFRTLSHYQRHWRKAHKPMLKVFPCPACPQNYQERSNLRRHLIRSHRYGELYATRKASGTESKLIQNSSYLSPRGMLPPTGIRTEVREEVIDVPITATGSASGSGEYIIQLGDEIPRDMDVEMRMDENGEFQFVAVPIKDFGL